MKKRSIEMPLGKRTEVSGRFERFRDKEYKMALKIKLVRSLNSCKKNQIATAKALGLHKINSETTQPDNEATRGKIKTIAHLVKVEEV